MKSVEVGDYCWISGTENKNNKIIETNYVVNTRPDKNLCLSNDSLKETQLWQGKKLEITTKKIKICQHIPPCEAHEEMIAADSITDFKVVK